ncbi:hypothetical protein [Bacillus sp. SD088]|uniref:hypothetical protein n=1 Tax=Bacillus sp. SD088 TaxID=2782012 RepID=UPI001A95B566|nr:hypothetical protein [Bacillus sp. SD088]MBO0995359.1 hypothetical protein [Bacillus sp. SD088]
MYYIPYTYYSYSPYLVENQASLYKRPMVRKQHVYPTVETEKLHQSAQKFQTLMPQANLLMNKINSSSTFAHELMDAAQQSNKQKVHKLIQSTGISSSVKSQFNPDGIIFEFSNVENGKGGCILHIALQW